MRGRRRRGAWLGAALVAAGVALGALACDSGSGDANAPSTTSPEGGDDAARAETSTGDDGAARLTIGVADESVYTGERATVTASLLDDPDDAGGSARWNVAAAPAGSASSSAAGGGLAASFVADVQGDYRVTFTAGGATASALVHALPAPVFFTRATFDSNGGEVAVHVANEDKSDDHAVACAITFPTAEVTSYRTRTLFAAATTTDGWEAPAGQPSRFAFSGTATLTTDDAGLAPSFLIAGTTRNSCTVVPTTLRAIKARPGDLAQPRFSPDGSRVAFVEPGAFAGGYAMSTVGFDGTGYRAVAAVGAGTDSPDVRATWKDATHLAWARPASGGGFEIVVVADAAVATPSVLMTCAAAATLPHAIAFAPDGSVLAAFAPSASAPTDLFVLAGAGCAVVRNLSALPAAGGSASRAHDFALSPDGATVAFLRWDATAHGSAAATGNEGDLFVAPVDGSKPAARVGTAAVVARIGPRWIAGGHRLAVTRAGTVADGGDARLADDVVVVAGSAGADAGAAVVLASGDGVNVVAGGVGPGGSCAVAAPPGGASDSSSAAGAGALLAAALTAWSARSRRRRRASAR